MTGRPSRWATTNGSASTPSDLGADQVLRAAGRGGQRPHLGDAPPRAGRQRHPQRQVGEGEVGEQLPVGDQPAGVVDLGGAGRRTAGEALGEAAHGGAEPRSAPAARPLGCPRGPARPLACPSQPARPEDFAAIAELTVRVYVDGGPRPPTAYAPELADVAGRADRADLLVGPGRATAASSAAWRSCSRATSATSPHRDDEAAFRMLVVDPAVRGRGVGGCWSPPAWSAARVGRQAPDVALDRSGGWPPRHAALPAAGLHPAAGAGLVARSRHRPVVYAPRPLPVRASVDRCVGLDRHGSPRVQSTRYGSGYAAGQRRCRCTTSPRLGREPLLLLHAGRFDRSTLQFGALLPGLADRPPGDRRRLPGPRADQRRRPAAPECGPGLRRRRPARSTSDVAQADVFGFSVGGATALAPGRRASGAGPQADRVVGLVPSRRGPARRTSEAVPELTVEMIAGHADGAGVPRQVAAPGHSCRACWTSWGRSTRAFTGWSDADIEGIAAPTLITADDCDAVTLDHAVRFLRLARRRRQRRLRRRPVLAAGRVPRRRRTSSGSARDRRPVLDVVRHSSSTASAGSRSGSSRQATAMRASGRS